MNIHILTIESCTECEMTREIECFFDLDIAKARLAALALEDLETVEKDNLEVELSKDGCYYLSYEEGYYCSNHFSLSIVTETVNEGPAQGCNLSDIECLQKRYAQIKENPEERLSVKEITLVPNSVVYEGLEYPTFAVVVESQNEECVFAPEIIQDMLFDKNGRFVSDEARILDEQIYGYLPNVLFAQPLDLVKKHIETYFD